MKRPGARRTEERGARVIHVRAAALGLLAAACVCACAGAPARPPPAAEVTSGEAEVVEAAPDPDRVPPQAALEEAAALAERGDRDGARRLLSRLAGRPGLAPWLRVRALVEGGVLDLDAGETDVALAGLREAVKVLAGAGPGAVPRSVAAHARFHLGEALSARLAAAPLEVESGPEALSAALEASSSALLEAQETYLAAGREGDPEVAVAAGARVGDLYDGLRRRLLAAPVPAGLGPAQAADYRSELGLRLRPLAARAEEAWSATLAEAQRRGLADGWTEHLELALARLRSELPDGG